MNRYLREKRMDEDFDVFSVRDIEGNNLFESEEYKYAWNYFCSNLNASYIEGEMIDNEGRCYHSDILACQWEGEENEI